MIKWIVLAALAACALYVHFRGRVRHRLLRQITDHSTFMAPINVLMYAFSRVPTTPYLAPADFPELENLRGNWQAIRDEAVALAGASHIKASDQPNDAGFYSFFRTGWKRFYLKWYDDAPHPSAERLCPRTLELLRAAPHIKAAAFTQLPPGSRLGQHRDPFAGSLRYHLGLITPNDDRCWIKVDGKPYSWRDGEGVLFDETYVHWAANETDQDRIILFCDFERPMKYRWAQALNRAVARTLLHAGASPNEAGDRTGGINHVFKYAVAVRNAGKALKQRNRRLYYATKWMLLIAILAAIFVPWRML
ncbi:MAG TPA: lipid A hydroxylase LpxO [Rhodanobacteraceae bacterium]|nr:lipid A hydroxylase LpxO [Rhodanobacteraceae bacterium]